MKLWCSMKQSTCSHTFASAKCREGCWQEINVNLMFSYHRLIIRAQDVLPTWTRFYSFTWFLFLKVASNKLGKPKTNETWSWNVTPSGIPFLRVTRLKWTALFFFSRNKWSILVFHGVNGDLLIHSFRLADSYLIRTVKLYTDESEAFFL